MNFSCLPFLAPGVAAVIDPTTYANLSAWWDANNLSYADATPIDDASAMFTDRSSNANHCKQATSGARPLLKTSIINSKKVVRFDGANDQLSATSAITFAGNFTIIAVGQFTMAAGETNVVFGHTSNGNRVTRIFTAGSVEQMGYNSDGGGFVSGTLATAHGSPHMMVWRRSGSTISFRENKTSRGTATDASSITLNLMASLNSFSYWKGDCGELFMYSANRTDSECDILYDSYLKPKWGLP
jgi:hypothetical protein